MRLNTAEPEYPQPHAQPGRQTALDFDHSADQISPFYCPSPVMNFHQLVHLRPSVLYIVGNNVHSAAADMAKDRLANTGNGVGSSGGVGCGRVRSITLDGSHLLPLENVRTTAEQASYWVTKEIELLKHLINDRMGKQARSTLRERQTFSGEFGDALLKGPTAQQPLNNKL